MRKDSIFLLLPAGLCAILGIIFVISPSLDILPPEFNAATYYFVGGTFFILALILFIATFTTPIKTPKASNTPDEDEFFEQFKTKYKRQALKTYLINFGAFVLVMHIGVISALLVGVESPTGIAILISMLAIYFYIAWVVLPKHLIYLCPSCNMKSLSCTVYLLQHGSNVEFECRECNLKVNWGSGITYLSPHMALKRD